MRILSCEIFNLLILESYKIIESENKNKVLEKIKMMKLKTNKIKIQKIFKKSC